MHTVAVLEEVKGRLLFDNLFGKRVLVRHFIRPASTKSSRLSFTFTYNMYTLQHVYCTI